MQAKAQSSKHINFYTSSCISLGGVDGINILLSNTVSATIPKKSLHVGTPSHFCNVCLGIDQFVPFPLVQCCLSIVMKLPLLVYNIVVGVKGKGVAYSSDDIRYCTQIALSA